MANTRSTTAESENRTETRSTTTRRGFAAAAGAAGVAALAGCTGGSGSQANEASGEEATTDTPAAGGATTGSASSGETVTILLTPENPSEVKKDYMPMQRYLEDQIDGLSVEYRVPLDYAAVRPALESKQAEMGMDDITLISAPDMMDVMGTAVTGGTAFYYSMMMTTPDSDISEPADIKGKTMAFADPLSTSGSIYALWEFKNVGLDIGEAPGSDKGADFQGTWSNHKAALEQLTNDRADACSTWGGTGMSYVPRGDLPSEVKEKSAYVSEAGSETPELDVFLWSEPIPKQPIYARKSWSAPVKADIEKALHAATEETMNQYKPDDYEGTLPFTTLQDTSIDNYQPVIKRVDDLGIDLTQG